MTVVVFMADPKNIFIYDYEFAKNVSPRDFTIKILHRTDTNLVLFNISSEDQQILCKDHQGKKYFAKSVVFSWIVFWLSLVTFQIIAHWRIYQTVYGPALSDKGFYGKGIEKFQDPYAHWRIYQTVYGPALSDKGFYRKGIEKFQDPYDVNPNDVDLFVNEIYSSGGSDLHAHATFNTSRPITKPPFLNITNQTVGQQFSDIVYYRYERKKMVKLRFPDDVNPIGVDLFVNEIYSPDGSDLHAHATFNTSRPITKHVDADGSENGGLWQRFRNRWFEVTAWKGSFFPSMKDSDGSKNGGLWQEFRNVCFTIADCKGSFFPSMKDEVNDSITKRRTVQDDSIIAQLGFSWLKMKCGVELERFDGNGLQCALL